MPRPRRQTQPHPRFTRPVQPWRSLASLGALDLVDPGYEETAAPSSASGPGATGPDRSGLGRKAA